MSDEKKFMHGMSGQPYSGFDKYDPSWRAGQRAVGINPDTGKSFYQEGLDRSKPMPSSSSFGFRRKKMKGESIELHTDGLGKGIVAIGLSTAAISH